MKNKGSKSQVNLILIKFTERDFFQYLTSIKGKVSVKKADDKCYNCAWSNELYSHEAIQEYIKVGVILYFIVKEWDFM